MNTIETETFYRALNDRTVRYGERPLDPGRRVAILPSPEFLATKPGQAAVLVTAELLCRMVRQVNLAFVDGAFHSAFGGPFAGPMHERLVSRMAAVAPPGEYVAAPLAPDDYVIHLGAAGSPWVADGADWSLYVGPGPSPLPALRTDNIFGASLAAITAVAHLFAAPFPEAVASRVANILTLSPQIGKDTAFPSAGTDLGKIWFVGCGSVGSAAAYFLALAGYRFSATLFDMDIVKLENLDRSPIFAISDLDRPKVEAVAGFLRQFDIAVQAEPLALGESKIWRQRQAGVPDVIVAAANERNVRYEIESQFPCVQVYGTTGKSWQSNVFRHVPSEPCSCCAFPPSHRETSCATGEVESPAATGKTIDAALPFLSFGAGLLAAAEIAKLALPGFPYSGQRGFFTPLGEELLYTRPFAPRADCVCTYRNRLVHRRMVETTRYSHHYKLRGDDGPVVRSL